MSTLTPLPALTAPVIEPLLAARKAVQPLAPTPAFAAMVPTMEDAFAVQHATGVALGAWGAGEVPAYWKSGAGSRAAALGHAPLMPAGVHRYSGEPVVVDLSRFISPGLEAEIAVRLGHDVTPAMAADLDEAGAAALVDAMAVSLEVVDRRWQNTPELTPELKAADFLAHGALVFGPWLPWQPALDWAAQPCLQEVGARPALNTVGTHPLGTPTWLLPVWLRHLTRHGATVPAGTMVTTGTWTGLTPLVSGERVCVAFAGLGEVVLHTV
jgi:2-keto-4-pentenoate hydratase